MERGYGNKTQKHGEKNKHDKDKCYRMEERQEIMKDEQNVMEMCFPLTILCANKFVFSFEHTLS